MKLWTEPKMESNIGNLRSFELHNWIICLFQAYIYSSLQVDMFQLQFQALILKFLQSSLSTIIYLYHSDQV